MADSAGDAARVGADPIIGVVCPLLVAVDEAGPGEPDTANRCAASDPPASLSLIQQRLVCLEADHVDCPRYVRATGSTRSGSGRLGRSGATRGGSAVGTAVASRGRAGRTPIAAEADAVVPVAPVVQSTRRSGARPARSRPGPIVVALGILLAAVVLAFAFTSLQGGFNLPGALASPGRRSSPSSLVRPGTTPSSSPTPTASPTPSPTPSPSPAASPSGTPQPSVPPAFVGMKPCPDAPDCYLYRVHSGDTLTGIAQRFGVTKAAIRSLNPEITDPSLIHVGDKIRIPLPTG